MFIHTQDNLIDFYSTRWIAEDAAGQLGKWDTQVELLSDRYIPRQHTGALRNQEFKYITAFVVGGIIACAAIIFAISMGIIASMGGLGAAIGTGCGIGLSGIALSLLVLTITWIKYVNFLYTPLTEEQRSHIMKCLNNDFTHLEKCKTENTNLNTALNKLKKVLKEPEEIDD